MGSHGIKDQVAIIGMGCTQFREQWDKSLDDLAIEAVHEDDRRPASRSPTSTPGGWAPPSRACRA